jgi:hypothetical protein
MSSIINTNQFAIDFLPPKKRLPKYIAWVQTLLNPLQVLYNTMFGTYKDGNAAAAHDIATAYIVGDQVQYIDKAVYECWVANIGKIPTDTNYWFKVQDKFVGIEPRMKYNAQHLLFEYALNEWFGTTFVNTPGASDIYIDNFASGSNVFYVGLDEVSSSQVVYMNGQADRFIHAQNITNTGSEFDIYVPIAVANDLTVPPAIDIAPNISPNNENIIRQIADQYCYAGINYQVITY